MKRIIVLSMILFVTACGGRLPAPKTAQGAIQKYFKSYGKKYEASDFGRFEIEEVEVSDISERQKGMVAVEAYLSLQEGEVIYKVRATLLKKTFRWKVISWENLGKSG